MLLDHCEVSNHDGYALREPGEEDEAEAAVAQRSESEKTLLIHGIGVDEDLRPALLDIAVEDFQWDITKSGRVDIVPCDGKMPSASAANAAC